jgi:UDP-N-acetylmuramoyl-tripeptide--D-alanyl-D-alanine ligase
MLHAALAELAAPLAAEPRGIGPGASARGVGTDSRAVRPGELFVALRGERFDGHDFVPAVLAAGAAAAVVARARADALRGPLLVVDEPRAALARLAAWHRARFTRPVIGVAGANGKTTTKDLLAAVLGARFPVLASEASFNNDVGVPLTLLRLGPEHRAAVVELGTNHPGELAPLVRLARPDLGVVTHLGEEHLEFFGSVAGAAEEEGWLAELLPPGGTLFLPGDNPWSRALAARTPARVVRAGRGPGNDWRAAAEAADAAGTTFEVIAPDAALSGPYRVNLLGAHQVANALLALAVGAALGLGREELRRGLAAARPAPGRMQAWSHAGVRVLEDCYNANPDSMFAGLATLAGLPAARRVAALGPMAELGLHAAEAHARVGARAAALGVDVLLAAGAHAAATAAAARAGGLRAAAALPDADALAAALAALVRPGDAVLVKASRSARFERVAAALRPSPDPA